MKTARAVRRRIVHVAQTSAVALAMVAAAGCGFHLRGVGGSAVLPASISTLRVVQTGGAANAPIAVAVRNVLSANGAHVVETGTVPTLTLLEERVDSQVAAVRTTTAKASEYTLRYSVSFRIDGPQPLAQQTIRLQRDYSFDPNQVLAKEREERELLRDLRVDAAQQIVRRLARAATTPNQ
ncbi:MAG: LPS assembly lipoprotein LptE [Sulfurifustis sp.]